MAERTPTHPQSDPAGMQDWLASLPEPIQSIPMRGELLEALSTPTSQIRKLNANGYIVTSHGRELPFSFDTPEQAQIAQQIVDHGIVLRDSCEKRSILNAVVRNSCKVEPKDTALKGYTLQIDDTLGTNISYQEKFETALQSMITRYVKEGKRNGVTSDGVVIDTILPKFANFLNTLPRRGEPEPIRESSQAQVALK